jgi:hypothetical protein
MVLQSTSSSTCIAEIVRMSFTSALRAPVTALAAISSCFYVLDMRLALTREAATSWAVAPATSFDVTMSCSSE